MNVLFLTILAFGVNLTDFAGFSSEWLAYRRPGVVLCYDYDRSGRVDLADLDVFFDGWCAMSLKQITISGTPDPDVSGVMTETEAGSNIFEAILGGELWRYGRYLIDGSELRWCLFNVDAEPENSNPQEGAGGWVGWWSEVDADYLTTLSAYQGVDGTVTVAEYSDLVMPPTISVTAGSDSLTVSLTGETLATHTVLYKLTTDTTWTTGGTRSGDGDVVITSLEAGSYQIIAYSTLDGQISAPSSLATEFVSSETTIEAAIYELLASDATLDAIVDGRISPMLLSQVDTVPSLTYQQITGVRNHTLASGTGNMVDSTFQINCYTDDYKTGRTLSNAVRSLLDSYSGTIGGVTIQKIMMESEGDLMNMTDDMTETRRFGKRLTFRVFFNE